MPTTEHPFFALLRKNGTTREENLLIEAINLLVSLPDYRSFPPERMYDYLADAIDRFPPKRARA